MNTQTETKAAPASAETAQCPNCNSVGLKHIYDVENVPVHSVLLMNTREEAVNYPRGNVGIGFCDSCGFLTNWRFEHSVHNYSPTYEDPQDFSDTFSSFAQKLARDLAEKYKLQGKTTLEIGCGKGTFLARLCEEGKCRGIGIDPSFAPERNPAPEGTEIEFIQDFYSEQYAHLSADLICCRHTLEHIQPTLEFMKIVRRTVGDDMDTVIWFELPDGLRVIQEGAFWDIYYEHASYFTLGSLSRVFRQTGFEVTDLEVVYDNQYLLLTAIPTDGPTEAKLDAEDDMDVLRSAVAIFPEVVQRVKQRWLDLIDDAAAKGERVVIWGGGSKGVAFLSTLGVGDKVDYAVDINPYKSGKFLPGTGHMVVGPDHLTTAPPDHVIVMNPIYKDEIQKDLDRLKINAKLYAV